ncbi:MAG: outer membrane protein assembly factor BamD [Pirellulaceae bacterium]|nr:outer membrane protein assembly factor BamD [Pirellulaceae bacterium]
MLSKDVRTAIQGVVILTVCFSGCSMFQKDRTPDASILQSGYQTSHWSGSETYLEANEEEDGIAISDFSPQNIAKSVSNSVKVATGNGANPEVAKQLYQQADQLYRQAANTHSETASGTRGELFEQAAEGFEEAAGRWPESALAQDAMFMVGESFFFSDQYAKANDCYEKLLVKYPHTRHLDVVEARRFSIASFWLSLYEKNPPAFYAFNFFDSTRPMRDMFGHAVRIFDKIRFDDPTGKIADDATLAAGNAHLRAGNFSQANDFYADLRKTFPSSEHQFHAHLFGIEAKLSSYDGPQYSGDVLDDTEELIDQIRKQFPVKSREHQEYLTRTHAKARLQKATREWEMARFFDRRRQYGAARMYYQDLVNNYSDVRSLSLQAQERLQEIADRPATPKNYVAWLTDLFPETEDAKPLIPVGTSLLR